MRKKGRRGMAREGQGSENRKRWSERWGESGMFHKKPSPPCSIRMRASAVGVAAQTATSQQESSCVTQSSSKTHTRAASYYTHTFSTV